eukprot:8769577-Pyramimonas_sp.AAC.1
MRVGRPGPASIIYGRNTGPIDCPPAGLVLRCRKTNDADVKGCDVNVKGYEYVNPHKVVPAVEGV